MKLEEMKLEDRILEHGSEEDSLIREDVARLAHALWEARGGGEGNAEEDWYRAEELLRQEA